MHPARLPEDELLKQCRVARGRAGGPGGQHRNKVETHVEITHVPTGISAQAGERRSQNENKRVAIRRLRLRLAVEHREPAQAEREASTLWRTRTALARGAGGAEGGGRIVCSAEHEDYPALLAEAMDALAAAGWSARDAGARLGVTPTSAVRLIADHPAALARVNAERAALGLHALR